MYGLPDDDPTGDWTMQEFLMFECNITAYIQDFVFVGEWL